MFVLSSGPVLNMLEDDTEIKGYRTRYGNEIKSMAYAEDTTIIVRSENSVKHIFKVYETYSFLTGNMRR